MRAGRKEGGKTEAERKTERQREGERNSGRR